MTEKVVIIHGLWVGSFVMRRLGQRLIDHGFDVDYFQYPTVKSSVAENAKRLHHWLQQFNASTVHFVAHSLGGLVLLECLKRYPNVRDGRVVLMGSPVLGSQKAKRLMRVPILRRVIGKAHQGLVDHRCECPQGYEVGVIAGTIPFGLGLLLGPYFKPNDGAVAVSETLIEGLKDQINLPSSHTGMVFNRKVADQVAYFLRHGQFQHRR